MVCMFFIAFLHDSCNFHYLILGWSTLVLSSSNFVGFMCTYPRDETSVHQQASLHQLHYPYSNSRHGITFISLCICKIIGASMEKTHTCGENRNCLYIWCVYSALFVFNAIFPHVYYLDIGVREKNSIILTIH